MPDWNASKLSAGPNEAEGLIWASLPTPLPVERVRRVWFGIGLLSDLGLPIDTLQMFLAAKELHACCGCSAPVKVLLADLHATSTGAPPGVVARRVTMRRGEVEAICRLLAMPCEVIRASDLEDDQGFREVIARTRQWLDFQPGGRDVVIDEYTVRGIADVLFLCRDGGLKVGWTASPTLDDGKGRHHEYEPDAIAAKIAPEVMAAYVRHGVTLTRKRRIAVPYTEKDDPALRLMLTGQERGGFRSKLFPPTEGTKRIHREQIEAVTKHLRVTVQAFDRLVQSLAGEDLLDKAESIVRLLGAVSPAA